MDAEVLSQLGVRYQDRIPRKQRQSRLYPATILFRICQSFEVSLPWYLVRVFFNWSWQDGWPDGKSSAAQFFPEWIHQVQPALACCKEQLL